MKKLFTIGAVVLLGHIAGVPLALAGENVDQAWVTQNLTPTPLAFTQNMGQWDDHVLFRVDAGEAVMWFTRDGVYYQFTRRIESSNAGQDPRDPIMFGFDTDADSVELMMVKATFVGASPNPEIVAEGLLDYKCNYFLGNDPDRWRTNVPNFSAITFKEIYPRVDIHFSSDVNGQVTYEFQEAPGADIAEVRVEYEGAAEITAEADGRKTVQTRWGQIVDAIDVLHGGVGMISPRQLSNSASNSSSQNQLQTVDQTKSPALQLYYSTFLGGTYADYGYGIAVDERGNAYVTGYTMSSDFPTQDALDSARSVGNDAFIAKFSSSGALIFSTFLGGDGPDAGHAIAEFDRGRVFVTGSTSSTDFPTQNPLQEYQGGTDVFVVRLTREGDSLVYSTYLGGTNTETGIGIAIDNYGRIYVMGQTFSSDFPTLNPYQTDQGGIDAFVTKLSFYGDSVIYSTYLGGGDHDYGYGIAVDFMDCAYITGYTMSSDFPTENAFQMDQGSYDAFVTKLSSSGSGLEYSTYLGGDNYDYGRGVALDGTGAIVTGYTLSSDFPTKNPYQADQGVADAFVTKLSSYGDSLVFSTYLGGTWSDYGYGIAASRGAIYVTGSTSSPDFPTLSACQNYQSVNDAFVVSLSASGDSLVYGTYLGGELHDYGYGVAVDTSGNAYIVGTTQSSDFPTRNPFQAAYQGGASGDVFVTKLNYGSGDLAFRPDLDGWQFPNGGGTMWPESWWQQFDYSRLVYPLSWRWLCSPSDFPDWHLFVRAFGVDQCYYDPDPGHPIYKPSAISRWFDIKQEYKGTCTGFAISSFLFYDGFLDVATAFPSYTDVYFVPLSDSSRLLVNMYWVYQFGEVRRAHQNANMHTTTPTQTLQACQEMFRSAERDDRVLYMGSNITHGGHSVNPYRCAVDPVDSNIYYIYIYDNNAPGDNNVRVEINTLTDTWYYDAKPTWGGTRRLFLSNPISDFTVPPVLSRTAASPGTLISGSKRSASQYAEFYLPSTGDVIFRFAADSIGLVSDSSFSTLTDGIPIIPETGQETPPIGYYLPNQPWHVQLSGFTDSTLRLTAYFDSTVIAYYRNDVDSTQVDELTYGGNDSSIVVVNPDIVSHIYDLQVISIRPDSEVVVKIGGFTSEAGDSSRFAITGESGLRIDNYGASSVYSIRVEIAGPTVDTVFFHDSVTIGGNSSHVIVPDWRQNNDLLIVQVDSGIDGSIDDTLFFNNNVLTDVDEQGATDKLPYRFELAQNYPNPFNPVTTIEYSLPHRSDVVIEVFDILGRRVRLLVNETRSAGVYKVTWDGTDPNGSPVSTGIYLYRIQAGDFVQSKKMVLIK